jgi:hypothetical protein
MRRKCRVRSICRARRCLQPPTMPRSCPCSIRVHGCLRFRANARVPAPMSPFQVPLLSFRRRYWRARLCREFLHGRRRDLAAAVDLPAGPVVRVVAEAGRSWVTLPSQLPWRSSLSDRRDCCCSGCAQRGDFLIQKTKRTAEQLAVLGISRVRQILKHSRARQLQALALTLDSGLIRAELGRAFERRLPFGRLDLGFDRFTFPAACHVSSLTHVA